MHRRPLPAARRCQPLTVCACVLVYRQQANLRTQYGRQVGGNRPMKTFLVGGAVRDQLLGRPVKERDFVVVGATREDLLGRGFIQVGKDFPVFLHPQTREEYALARTERKTAPGHKGFIVHADADVTLEQDLQRRDLTINALARDTDGGLIDPFGGQKDLQNRLLRHVSPSFSEDPVRILRVARFAARYASLGFRVAEETLTLMRRMVQQGQVDELVAERVWQELVKALGEDRPSRFFAVLSDCGALPRLFPELVASAAESLAAVDQAADMSLPIEVRFATLTHCLGGTGENPRQFDPSSIESLCQRLKAPRRFTAQALLLARYHGLVDRAAVLSAENILEIIRYADALRRPVRFEHFLLGCRTIYCSAQAGHAPDYPQAELMRRALDAVREIDLSLLLAGQRDPAQVQQIIRQQRIKAIERTLGENVKNGGANN